MWHYYVLFNIAEDYRSLQHVRFLLCQHIGAELHVAVAYDDVQRGYFQLRSKFEDQDNEAKSPLPV